MSQKNYILPLEVKHLNTLKMSAVDWSTFYLYGIPEACFLIRLTNDSTISLFLSYDGVTIADIIRNKSSVDLNYQTNSFPNNYVSKIAIGSKIYVKKSANVGSLGSVYLSGYYNAH